MSDSNPPARLGRMPLWKEITIILVIKAGVLCLIWFAFFSGPPQKPDPPGVAAQLLRPDAQPIPYSSQQETGHAARSGTR